jgi:dihydrofolate reductase
MTVRAPVLPLPGAGDRVLSAMAQRESGTRRSPDHFVRLEAAPQFAGRNPNEYVRIAVRRKGTRMGKIVVTNHLSLDGVMQAPGRADEDRRDGFEHGGWATPNTDEVMGKVMGEGMARGGPLLFGRRTYEDFAAFWPKQKDNPYTEVLDNAQKYVASRTLKEPLPWQNSTLLEGDAVEAVARLKEESGKDIGVLGSGELVRSLMRGDLVDEYVLMIHPLVLGSGRRLFADDGEFAALRLLDTVTTTTGVVIATYGRAAEPAQMA